MQRFATSPPSSSSYSLCIRPPYFLTVSSSAMFSISLRSWKSSLTSCWSSALSPSAPFRPVCSWTTSLCKVSRVCAVFDQSANVDLSPNKVANLSPAVAQGCNHEHVHEWRAIAPTSRMSAAKDQHQSCHLLVQGRLRSVSLPDLIASPSLCALRGFVFGP